MAIASQNQNGSPPYTLSIEENMQSVVSTPRGLSTEEARARLVRFGLNNLPHPPPPGLVITFIRQFLNPLIYILLAAAIISTFLHEWSDSLFIYVVLLLNAVIGTIQEYSAERSAATLQSLVTTRTRVIRNGEESVIDAQELVPGDIVLLESGNKVPADLRFLTSHGLEIDESLLTGESLPVLKDALAILKKEIGLGDRINMAFAGTLVTRGRASGLVVATGLATEIGRLSQMLYKEKKSSKPPLLLRMEKFTSAISLVVLACATIIFVAEWSKGAPWHEVFLLSVALAVSAIPEGLPVALTVALAIGMRRMAKRHVIVRRLVAVEALGSCTYIASDKTGTLTVNQLTVRQIAFPYEKALEVTGEGTNPDGEIIHASEQVVTAKNHSLLNRMARAAIFCNEGYLRSSNQGWSFDGDSVDVALLVMAHKANMSKAELWKNHPQVMQIPFESDRQFAASVHEINGELSVFIKGALEQVLKMCDKMLITEESVAIDKAAIAKQAEGLAREGYRLLAFADGKLCLETKDTRIEQKLCGLTFIGLAAMIDPLRPEAKGAIDSCRRAGIKVSMITGDHPETALAIARELQLAKHLDQVVTGSSLKAAHEIGHEAMDAMTREARVFARVEPEQKVHIVKSIIRNGHFVAVTGDGANDAPALSAAHVGVAMGKRGTDVARESASLILTDDNFASIVAGVEEGRVAYGNVRKVIFLLISTGAAEIILFALALSFGLPLPFFATQLLWLNLVTNGIQDVALAFEPAEGNEMSNLPRSPRERIFNRLMIGRVLLSAMVIGLVVFFYYRHLLLMGWTIADARNSALLLMVLFENIHVLNSRSEVLSVFQHNPFNNIFLLVGTILAQLLHIAAMYTPILRDILGVHPVSLSQWSQLLGLALSLLVVMEMEKFIRTRIVRRINLRSSI